MKTELKNKPVVFKNLETAKNFAARAVKPMTVVFGDCPQYWVVTVADAMRLVKQGYEVAE